MYMKKLIFTLVLLLGSKTFAAETCLPCTKAGALTAIIETSHIKADALNPKTFDRQMKFVDDAADIIEKLLAIRKLKPEHAEALLHLLKAVRPYDVRMEIPEIAVGPFAKLYAEKSKNKSVLKQKMEALVLAGTFTAQDKLNVLIYMGVVAAPEVSEEEL
jgi:hypothetical protein